MVMYADPGAGAFNSRVSTSCRRSNMRRRSRAMWYCCKYSFTGFAGGPTRCLLLHVYTSVMSIPRRSFISFRLIRYSRVLVGLLFTSSTTIRPSRSLYVKIRPVSDGTHSPSLQVCVRLLQSKVHLEAQIIDFPGLLP